MDKKYWDNFYSGVNSIDVPSQFCAFFLQDAERNSKVIEFGCGNGRDSRVMANLGYGILGLDSSEEAVKTSQSKAVNGSKYQVMDVENIDLNVVNEYIGNSELIYIYSRFFQHSITDEQEDAMFKSINKFNVKKIIAYFEFRNNLDEKNFRVYDNHYRRFQSEKEFLLKLTNIGFDISYAISGKGYSKYGNEDPDITRVIAERSM